MDKANCIRLNRFLGSSGVCSRREADVYIAAGRVKINGRNADLGSKVVPGKDVVVFDGKEIRFDHEFRYILFHKPKGYVVSQAGQFAPSIYECNDLPNLPYVGRLDKDTTGLLLLTNDGDLCFRLTHPRYKVEKHYEATLSRLPTKEEIENLEKGVLLDDGMTAPAQARITDISSRRMEIVIHEGRKRQIRRMVKAVGIDVMELHRSQFGPLSLHGFTCGKWRELISNEVDQLKRAVGL